MKSPPTARRDSPDRRLDLLAVPITVLDAVGLSLFAVTGTGKALELGLGVPQAVILGAVTAVGGGTLRDIMVARVPTVLRSGLYAIAACAAAAFCFTVRMAGVRWDLHAPTLPGAR